MQPLLDLFNNSIMQSMFFGPIMGIVFASIFAGLTKQPSTEVPKTIFQTKEIYIHKIIEHRRYKNNTDDGAGVLILAGMGIFFIVWKYSIYVNMIHYYIEMGLITALSFSIVTTLISYFKGQFTSNEW